jgi:pimeloyl-ACP methyl ester carboxylesterase
MATKTPGSASAQTEALGQLAAFPLVEALFGRRSRRFALGGEIPDGPLAYRSRHQPMPLDELERLLVLTAMGGTTGWHYSITRHARYAPHVSNYAAAAGRTFPSAAGFHTAELFFTDDSGVWFFPTRDAGALVDPAVEQVTPELMVQRHRGRLRQLAEGRLYLPAAEPYLEGHNTWCVNVPGSLLVIPVADIAQHLLAILCFFAQNGYGIYDDVNRRQIPGLEQFRGLVDVEEPVPLTFAEQYALTEATAELACACYAGVLVLQAMGLGGPFHPDTPGAWTDSPRIRGSAQVLRALEVPSAHIAGFSMGSAIAQELALRHPELVRSLVLQSTYARPDALWRSQLNFWRWLPEAAPSEQAFFEAFFTWVYTPRAHADGSVAQIVEEALAFPHRQSVEAFQAQVDVCLTHDTADRLSEIAAPTLVLSGELDSILPPRFGRSVAAGIPNVRFEVLPGEAHQPFQEVPDLWNTRVDAFWRQIKKRD